MCRNDECINKVIRKQQKRSSDISETIYRSFKKIFFDIKVKEFQDKKNENKESPFFEFGLGDKELQVILNKAVSRFNEFTKTSRDKEEERIKIQDELKYFLKSIGNRLNDQQIDFMLHLVIEYEKNGDHSSDELTCDQLKDIMGAIRVFSNYNPQVIFYEVLNYYYISYAGVFLPKNEAANELDSQNIK